MAALGMHSLERCRLTAPLTSARPQSLPGLKAQRSLVRNTRRLKTCAYFTVKGPGPRGANKQSYICRDCGYIYEGKDSFESLSKEYECPVCAAPKRRFKPYDNPVERNANATANRKARKNKLQSGPDATQLVIFLLGGAVVLVGLYAILNSVF